jgi:hypothetical protein
MWRTPRSCGKQPEILICRRHQLLDNNALRGCFSRKDFRRCKTPLRWKTSCFLRRVFGTSARCPVPGFLLIREFTDLFHVEQLLLLAPLTNNVPRGTLPALRSTILSTFIAKTLYQLPRAGSSVGLYVGGSSCASAPLSPEVHSSTTHESSPTNNSPPMPEPVIATSLKRSSPAISPGSSTLSRHAPPACAKSSNSLPQTRAQPPSPSKFSCEKLETTASLGRCSAPADHNGCPIATEN